MGKLCFQRERKTYKGKGAVASLEILLHAIDYPHRSPQNFTVFATPKIFFSN